MTKGLYTPAFEMTRVATEYNPTEGAVALNGGEIDSPERVKLTFLPSAGFRSKSYLRLKDSLNTLQQSGKIVAKQLGLNTDEDIFRYLSEK